MYNDYWKDKCVTKLVPTLKGIGIDNNPRKQVRWWNDELYP